MSLFWPSPPGPTGLFWLSPASLPYWYYTATAIGSAAGAFSINPGTITVAGTGGSGITGTSDSLFFANQPVSGNIELIGKVTLQTGTNAYASAGLMISDLSVSYPAAAQCAMISVSPQNGVNFSYRLSDNTAAITTLGPSLAAPIWLRLVVSGSSIAGFQSSDGISWKLVGECTMKLNTNYFSGLAVYSNVGGLTNTATFTNVYQLMNVPQRSSTVRPTWIQTPIGSVSGSFSANPDGSFTVGGSGTGVHGIDSYQFVGQPVGGNIELIAEVVSMTGTNADAFGGIAISDLSPTYPTSSQCIVIGARKADNVLLACRLADNTSPFYATGSSLNAPRWFRLVVTQGVVDGYESADGITWAPNGGGQMTLPQTFYIGFAAYSNDSTVNSVTYQNVSARISSNMISWLRCDANVSYDGSNLVSFWGDQSSTGNNATQTNAANQPSLVTNAINGLPAIRFNGSSSFLQFPADLSDFSLGLTLFLVINPAATASLSQMVNLGTASGSAYNLGVEINSLSKAEYFVYDSTGSTMTGVSYGAAMPTGPQLIEAVQCGATGIIFNRGLNPVINYSMNNIPVPSSGRPSSYLGQAAGGGNYFNGQIAEVLLYNRVLTASERQSIEGYLINKFSL